MSKATAGFEISSHVPNEVTEVNTQYDKIAEQIADQWAENPVEQYDKPQDHCGVWGVWDPKSDRVLDDAFIGLVNIQHRGEGGAGIASVSPTQPGLHIKRKAGKVRKVFGEDGAGVHELPEDSHAAIAQTRWPTDSAEGQWNQPRFAKHLALAHNGQLTNKHELIKKFCMDNEVSADTSDTEVVTEIINKVAEMYRGDIERAVASVLPHLEGAFCFTILANDPRTQEAKLIAVRDRAAMRPLQLGRTATGGYIVASEFMAISHVPGATWEREVEAAEMIVIDKNGLRTGKFAQPEVRACMLEYVYLANKETTLNGILIKDARRGFGRKAAKYLLPDVEAIVAVPTAANQGAHGLAEATGIPDVPALIINPDFEYSRSFIQPDQATRDRMADLKVIPNPDPEVLQQVEGKVVAGFDDSMIRSTVAKNVVPKLRKAGAARVDLVIGADMYSGTCDLGVDTPNRADLIAARHNGNIEAMREETGADNLIFITRQDMHDVVGDNVCDSCLGGERPAPIPIIEIDEDLKERIAARNAGRVLVGASA